MNPPLDQINSNFSFLEAHELLLVRLGSQAEKYFDEDPSTCLIKLRQFAELLAQKVSLSLGVEFSPNDDFINLLNGLRDRGIARQVLDIFHGIRKSGNAAAHVVKGDHAEALHQLKMARILGEWYVRLITKNHSFAAPPFVPPPNPLDATKDLKEELEQLRKRLTEMESAASAHAEEATVWRKKAQESEEQLNLQVEQFKAKTAELSQASSAKTKDTESLVQSANLAGEHLDLDESDTRRLIDEQLRNAGWEADTENLRYSSGTRPIKGRNLAIAEWPTASGPADYALFIGNL